MKPSDILKQIRPCDVDQPYIFVSYSTHDHPRVWEDVLTFQNMGYNIWLDEKNLDKTKASWTDDALTAITDLDCQLVVFYVSSHSLTSNACYRELSQTTETLTVRVHFGAVPFIAVDVDNVGDIGAYTQAVYSNLMRQNISKKEKTEKAIVLSQFTDNFFDSNNERVRIHPKDEPNRKIDYYGEIVASFPDSTKIYPPKADAVPFPVTEPKPEPIPQPAPAPQPKPEPIPQPAPAPQPKPEPIPQPPAPQSKPESIPQPAPAPQSKPEEPAKTPLTDQLAALLRRRSDLLEAVPPEPAAAQQPASGAEASGSASTEPAEGASLADQISRLLGNKPAEEAKPDAAASLREQIQRQLEERRNGAKK